MEVKSVSDCLNIIDIAFVKGIDMWSLENIHKYLLKMGLTNLDDERDAVMEMFKQIN